MTPEIPAPVPLAQLKRLPFFDRLSDTILAKLQPHLVEKRFAPGETLLRLGDYSDAAYYISSGAVEVHVPQASAAPASMPPTRATASVTFAGRLAAIFDRRSTDHAVQSAGWQHPAQALADLPADRQSFQRVRLGEGEIFGEIGALSRYPVTADVVAATDVAVVMIGTPALRLMMKQRDLADFKAFIDNRYRTRTLASHLRRVELFEGIGDELIEKLRDHAALLSFDPGASIVEQGSSDEAFYLVRGGHVRVAVGATAADRTPAAVTYLRRGDYAGEIGLLTGEPWPFSMSAIEHVEMVRISREDFAAVLAAKPALESLLRDAVESRRAAIARVQQNPASSSHLQMAIDSGLINGQSVLLIDMTTCTGCDDCVRGCADTHGGVPRFVRQGSIYQRWNIPVACYQCSDPVCMIGCPTGAITRPLGGLAVAINDQTCIGCSNCVNRCPWHNIIPIPHQSPQLGRQIDLATKCDLCIGRPDGPACVQMCPHGSASRISFQDVAAVTKTFAAPPIVTANR